MKKRVLLISLFAISTAFAQHKIDLSKVKQQPLKYLKMGNPGNGERQLLVNNLYMEQAGVPQVPVMGEFHYSRMDHRYWRDALQKMKASGVDIVATYSMWSLHEEIEGEMSWRDNLNLRKFIKICQELDLKVHLRFGPYCNAEIKNGALPDWLVSNTAMSMRSNDPLYLEYTRRWYQAVFDQVGDLLHKDGGPIMGLQLENEYVREGMVIAHLTSLKKMACEIGFDVPIYSMTHWMSTDYPKGEIVPYAGYYIETPWTTSGKNELETSNFEFFSYNRISDNIGTDIIKLEGEVESLSGEDNESPYFTCEVGVGSTSFYGRRAVIPQQMAGENINLRLGCGVNLMGYYMYVGGSNPVGKTTTFQSSGPRVNYDYQAPVREFGNLGEVMWETKKYNYFMNDFGSELAPAIAYLPTSNHDTNNLQWAVRAHNNSGFIFCSNYLYKHNRPEFKNIQFAVKFKDETITLPRNKTVVEDGVYFLWPLNQSLSGITLKYSTTQPICSHKGSDAITYFFFEDDAIGAEYLVNNSDIKEVVVSNGVCKKEKNGYFINGLQSGTDCVIEITKNDNSKVRLVTLTEKESDQIWKGNIGGRDFVAITNSSLVYDHSGITLIDDNPSTQVSFYNEGRFISKTMNAAVREIRANVKQIPPMASALKIKPSQGNKLSRKFALKTLAQSIDRAFLRYTSSGGSQCLINSQPIESAPMGQYNRADITKLLVLGDNLVEFTLSDPGKGVIAEIEVMLHNGQRVVWGSDATWAGTDPKQPAVVLDNNTSITKFAPEEHLNIYQINAPTPACGDQETRLYISYRGDVANAYLDGNLIGDSFFDGTEWIMSLSRMPHNIEKEPLIIRIDGLKSADDNIYFERNVDPSECVDPHIKYVNIKQEYRFPIHIKELL